MKYLMIPEGKIDEKIIPVTVAFLDAADIEKAGLTQDEAIIRVAGEFTGPVAINVFDREAITTTSDFSGAFNQAKTRQEFTNLIHNHQI